MDDLTDVLDAPRRPAEQPSSEEEVARSEPRKQAGGIAPKVVDGPENPADLEAIMPLMPFLPEPPEGFDDDDPDTQA